MSSFAIRNREINYLCSLSLSCVFVFEQWHWRFAFRLVPFQKNLIVLNLLLDFGEHSNSCSRVKVPAFLKGLDHGSTVSHMSQHPQLQLPVVSNDKLLAFGGLKGLSNFIDVLVKSRLILQVWLPCR